MNELIEKFLDVNYFVTTNTNGVVIKDVSNLPRYHTLDDLIHIIKKVFGVSEGKLCEKWFNPKRESLLKELYDTFDKLDLEIGSKEILENINIQNFTKEFIKIEFQSFYFKNKLDDKIDTYIKIFDKRKSSIDLFHGFQNEINKEIDTIREHIYQHLKKFYLDKVIPNKIKEHIDNFNKTKTSIELINTFGLDNELLEFNQYISNKLNEWYSLNIFKEKIEDLFSQFVINLGATNWIITWIGHGVFNQSLLEKYYNKETDYQYNFAMRLYDKWLEEAIMDKSERMILSNPTFNSIPNENEL